MLGLRCIVTLIFLAAALPTNAASQSYTANTYLSGCKEALSDKATMASGRCLGVIEGLAILGQLTEMFCAPTGAASGQRIRVVLAFVEARPARMHEDFRLLALEALKEAWPCKKGS